MHTILETKSVESLFLAALELKMRLPSIKVVRDKRTHVLSSSCLDATRNLSTLVLKGSCCENYSSNSNGSPS